MPAAAAEPKNRSKFSVRDFGRSICDPANIVRAETQYALGKNAYATNSARASLSNVQSVLLRLPERGQFDSLGHCEGGKVRRLAAFGDRLDDPGR